LTLFGGVLRMWAGVVVAEHPPLTEGAGVLAKGKCEIETIVARERATDAATACVWSVYFDCGVEHDTQLALNVTRANVFDGRADRIGVLGKTGLRKLKDDQAGVALAYVLLSVT
jgi:hypothetical protein